MRAVFAIWTARKYVLLSNLSKTVVFFNLLYHEWYWLLLLSDLLWYSYNDGIETIWVQVRMIVQRMIIRCFSCFLCPICNSQLCGLKDENTSCWEWTCFGCSWKSLLNATTLSELKCLKYWWIWYIAISNNQINQNRENELNTLKSAAECVRFELGLSDNVRPSPYDMPYTHSKKSNAQIREEKQTVVHQQQDKIESQLCATSLTLPVHPSLRAKRTIKCLSCSQEGISGLLCKPQVQPLLGDSSLFIWFIYMSHRVKGHDSWFRVANLGLFSVPQFSVVRREKENIFLRIRNVWFISHLHSAWCRSIILHHGRHDCNNCRIIANPLIVVVTDSCELYYSFVWWNHGYWFLILVNCSWLWPFKNSEWR